MHDMEKVIDEFLGENPRAQKWRELRQSLAERLAGLKKTHALELPLSPNSEKMHNIETQIAALERQVHALETEEVVAEFVENSLRVTLARSTIDEDMD